MPTPPVNPTTIFAPDGTIVPVFLDVKTSPTDPFCGTATPAALLQINSANGATTINGIQVEELPDSPLLERAEQATITKKFRMPFTAGRVMITLLGRGTILEDTEGNFTRVLSSTLQREKPEMCVITIVSEGLSFDTPPDEFSCEPVELGINIIKHPRYFYALDPQAKDINGNYIDTLQVRQIKQAIIRAIQTYQDSPFFPSADNVNGLIQNSVLSSLIGGAITYTVPNPLTGVPTVLTYIATASPSASVNLAFAAAQEIISKIWRMEDNPYLVGFQITWSVYYYRPPEISPGGYIQNPISGIGADNPGLPDYFYSPDNPPATTDTIFDDIPQFNPQCYSSDGTIHGTVNISWLRKADVVDYQRTWFKVTRTWIGSAIGAWDAQIFSQNNRPAVPTDYQTLS